MALLYDISLPKTYRPKLLVTDNILSKTVTILILLVALGTSGGEGFKTLVPNYPFSSQSRVRGLCFIKRVTYETWMADFVKRQYESRFSFLPIHFLRK